MRSHPKLVAYRICSKLLRFQRAYVNGYVLREQGLLLEYYFWSELRLDICISTEFYGTHITRCCTVCSDETGVDVFFIFVKLSSLEDGIQMLAEYCPSLVYFALHALERTQSDDVRANSLGTLSNPADLAVDPYYERAVTEVHHM